VLKFATDSIGSLVSPNRIAARLSEQKAAVSRTTVDSYLSALCDSYVFYRTERYNVRGRSILQTLNKYYLVDTGFIRVLLGKDTRVSRFALSMNRSLPLTMDFGLRQDDVQKHCARWPSSLVRHSGTGRNPPTAVAVGTAIHRGTVQPSSWDASPFDSTPAFRPWQRQTGG
jgi:hypothetical protein